MLTISRSLVVAVTLALAGTVGLPQNGAAQDSGSQQASPKTDWSDQKLQGFVTAAMSVQKVYSNWQPKINNAESSEAEKKMRRKANDAAVSAVKDSPVSVEEYTKINRAMQQDRELYKKVRGMMKDTQ